MNVGQLGVFYDADDLKADDIRRAFNYVTDGTLSVTKGADEEIVDDGDFR